ncbi:MAG TPA: OmpA family protein [Cytophagaceae bacterium]|jgi:outer membrane protein OmpA-like peptidoglycan-associated protein/tetratricopeptide (TPR) repeat protein
MKPAITLICTFYITLLLLPQQSAFGQEQISKETDKSTKEKKSNKEKKEQEFNEREKAKLDKKLKSSTQTFPEKKKVDPTKTSEFAQLTADADKFFIHEHYKFALPLYLKILNTTPDDMVSNYRTGISYLHTTDKSQAVSYLEKAQKLDLKKQHLDLEYFLGRAYHHKHEFDNAISHYELYKRTLNVKHEHERELANEMDRFIKECKAGKILVAKPTGSTVEHVGAKVNSPYSEKYPLITSDGKVIYFSSGRPHTKGGQLDPTSKQYYDDIYFSVNTNGEWSPAKQIDTTVNTSGHDEPLAISFDGYKMFVQNSDAEGDILWTEKKDNIWSKPLEMTDKINTPDFEEGACLSPDGKTFYFSSDKEDGLGGLDLYYSKLQPDGSWSAAVNMGAQINTPYDEEDPFLLGDGKTFYFSSNGHNTIGGYDIFVTRFEQSKGGWTVPENMGYPINSADDEVHISWTADGKKGYYSEDNENGFGNEDIYSVSLDVAPKVSELVKPVEPLAEQRQVATLISKGDTPSGFTASTNSTEKSLANVRPTDISCPKVGEILKDRVHFALNENYTLTEYSKNKILNVIKLMESCPSAKIEIEGFSDNFGDHAKNYLLISKKRAEAVYEFMVRKGIAKERLKVMPFEETPREGSSNTEGNIKNRRVEFKVLEN